MRPKEQREILTETVSIPADADKGEYLWNIACRRRFINLPASQEYLSYPPVRIAINDIRQRVFGYQDVLPLGPCHLGLNWSINSEVPTLAFSEIMAGWFRVEPEDIEASFRGDEGAPNIKYPTGGDETDVDESAPSSTNSKKRKPRVSKAKNTPKKQKASPKKNKPAVAGSSISFTPASPSPSISQNLLDVCIALSPIPLVVTKRRTRGRVTSKVPLSED